LVEPDPVLRLAFLGGKVGDRKLRLFACACCRLVWVLLAAAPGRARVEAAERAADGLPVARELADSAGLIAACSAKDVAGLYAEVASIYCAADDAFVAALAASVLVERADPRLGGRSAQTAVLADLFGQPARDFDDRWRTREVVSLAQTVYEERRFKELPRLAELLAAAGCDDPVLLSHCREAREHVRGCWAVDLARSGE
jgi:hypothetical protein